MKSWQIDGDVLINALLLKDQKTINKNIGEVFRFLKIPLELDVNNLLQSNLIALQLLSNSLQSQGDLISSYSIARSMLDFFENQIKHNHPLWDHVGAMIVNIMTTSINCMTDIGKHSELVDKINDWRSLVENLDLPDGWDITSLNHIKIKEVEALILSAKFENAYHILQEIEDEVLSADQIFAKQRLVQKLPTLMRNVDEPTSIWSDFSNTLEGAIEYIADSMPILLGMRREIKEKEGQYSEDDLYHSQTIRELGSSIGFLQPHTLSELEEIAFNIDSYGHPRGTVSGFLQGVGKLIQDPNFTNKDELNDLLNYIKPVLSYTLRHDYWDDANTLEWATAVIHNRLNNIQLQASTIQTLRGRLKQIREKIDDPRMRAGMAEILPHVYPQLLDALLKLYEEKSEIFDETMFFEILEESKSWILEELILEKFPERRHHTTVDKISNLQKIIRVSASRIHYFSFFVTPETTYVIHMGPNGNLSPNKIELTQESVKKASKTLDNLFHGNLTILDRELVHLQQKINKTNLWDRDISTLQDLLEPLILYFENLYDENILKDEDHIIYSPDAELYNVPFHLLKINNNDLIDHFSFSVIPSLGVLLATQNKTAATHATPQMQCVMVPAGDDPQLFFKDVQWLLDSDRAELLPSSSSDFLQLKDNLRPGNTIHFGTHGIFQDKRPLDNSGLYVSKNGFLPWENADFKLSTHLLTPNNISQLFLTHSHVTIRACVSGSVTQINAREALGVLWSLFQSGIESTLLASWKVDLTSAVTLIHKFYKEWLEKKNNKSAALRNAILAMKSMKKDYSHPYHWAPFILYGYL